jgi:serine/threonine protein kinase
MACLYIHTLSLILSSRYFRCSGNLYLVFELLDHDLKAEMDTCRETGLPLPRVREYLKQMLLGTHACHVHRVLHRDIKPQNILINHDKDPARTRIKLADFGLAKTFGLPLRAYTHEVVTLWYRPPEILFGGEIYSPAIDIWSLGCIFAEMSNGKALFPGDSEIDQIFKITSKLGTPSPETWPRVSSLPDYSSAYPNFRPIPFEKLVPKLPPSGRHLLEQMLQIDPEKRISPMDALKHPFFAEMASS